MAEIDLDPELLSDFIIESGELLDEFNANVIELEQAPQDMKTVGAIFRAAHTLKGSSAFFNLTHIKNFAHKLENLLDELRNMTRSVSPEVIDTLLTGGGHLKAMFARLGGGDYSVALTGEEDAFLQKLLGYLEQGPGEAQLSPEETLTRIAALTLSLPQSEGEAKKIVEQVSILAAGYAAKPDPDQGEAETGPAGGRNRYLFDSVDMTGPIDRITELLETGLETGNLDTESFDGAVQEIEAIINDNGLEELKGPFNAALDDYTAIRDSDLDFDTLLVGMTKEKWDELIGLLEVVPEELPALAADEAEKPVPVEPEDAPVTEAAPTDQPAAPPPAREERVERKTMRIDEDKVDGFMSYVGELIVTAETFSYLQKMVEAETVNPQTVRAFKNANQAFRELSDELQESLMEIRRVPVKNLLQKVNMMSRELSHQMKKKVRVEIEGQDVQVDKSIAESLEGPLVHVVRNSLDHGLEPPEEREGAGKAAEGVLQVSATSDKEYFYLVVADDGRGIDPEKMRQNAAEKGLMGAAQAEALSDREAVNLIFHAGFSTAKEITDVSGRGVGMDVVLTNINKLNGSINVDSQKGEGTTITLKIPLSVTLQVVKALLVRVGNENFIISLEDILESLRPDPGDLSTIEGRGEVFMRRGQVLPLIRLHEVFSIDSAVRDPAKAILVVVENALGRFGLLVDEVIGQSQVVVKELAAQFKQLTFIAGSATLGDGRLGLVLDTEGVVRLARGEA